MTKYNSKLIPLYLRKQTRMLFNEAEKTDGYEEYHNSLTQYNREVRRA